MHLHQQNHNEVMLDKNADLVFVASRHDSHASYVEKSLRKANKHVFVEKPLCLNEVELASIDAIMQQNTKALLMVGFNRRFAPVSVELNKLFSKITEPKVVNIRVNAGFIPLDH